MSSKVKGRRRFRYAPIAASEPWSLFPTAPEDSLGWVGVGPVQMWGCVWVGHLHAPARGGKSGEQKKECNGRHDREKRVFQFQPVPTRRAVLPLSTGEHAAKRPLALAPAYTRPSHTKQQALLPLAHHAPTKRARAATAKPSRASLSRSAGSSDARAQHSR